MSWKLYFKTDAEEIRLATEQARKVAEELPVLSEKARQTTEMLRQALRDQQAVFNEIRRTTLEFDRAAQEYREITELLKQEQAKKEPHE